MTKRMSATGVRGVYQQGDRYIARISGVVKRTNWRMPKNEKLKAKALERIENKEMMDARIDVKGDATGEVIHTHYRKTFLGSFDTIDEARAAYETAVREKREKKEEARREKRADFLDRRGDMPKGVVRRVNMRGESFHAYLTHKRKCRYLGKFDTPEEAHKAYLSAKNLVAKAPKSGADS